MWGLDKLVSTQAHLSELDSEFESAVKALSDPDIGNVVRILNAKLNVITDGLMADTEQPAQLEVEISAEGIGFANEEPLSIGSLLGSHLVLPSGYHLLCHAEVTHTHEVRRGSHAEHHIGARFVDMPAAAARRLNRLLMANTN